MADPSTGSELVAALGLATEPRLAAQIFQEATDLEEAFALKRWKYTELDGGRFAEVAARIIYGIDSGRFNLTKGVDECLKYLDNDQVPHHFPDRQSANQLTRILRAVYKLRSQRGAVHVSPTYTANEIDSRMVVEGVRWVLAELLRIFVTSDQGALVAAIEELSRFPYALIRNYGGQPLVQNIHLTAEEEVLVHLLNNREGMIVSRLIQVIPKDPTGVRRAVKNLAGGKVRQVVSVGDKWQITDLGIGRIESRLIRENRSDQV
jgi:hypothetical protein